MSSIGILQIMKWPTDFIHRDDFNDLSSAIKAKIRLGEALSTCDLISSGVMGLVGFVIQFSFAFGVE